MKALSHLFSSATAIALVGWVVLIVFPSWRFGLELVLALAVTLLSALYVYLIWFGKRHDEGERVRGSFWSLKGVISLFKSPRVVLAGWVHYLAFDLMVGAYIVADAARFDISHWFLIPCLLLTLMFGPAGLLAYFALRALMENEFGMGMF